MRGDRPCCWELGYYTNLFTPHARGSTWSFLGKDMGATVYPACAGIDLLKEKIKEIFDCLPRMRGDRPVFRKRSQRMPEFTPHARGSTSNRGIAVSTSAVYPACAGIDPILRVAPIHTSSLPRMRGDRPIVKGLGLSGVTFTPHARGSTRTAGPQDRV